MMLFKRFYLTVVALLSFLTTTVNADTIIIFGATGTIGSKIVEEALSRGHDVIGVSRSPDTFSYTEVNFKAVKGNPTSLESVMELTGNADAIINAVGGRTVTDPKLTTMNLSAIAFSKALGALGEEGPQIVTIGGGMTMNGSREKILEKMPPNATEGSAMRALFLGHWEAYQTYLSSNLNWVFLAPPMNIIGFRNGEDIKTGQYRTSTTGFVKDSEGNNAISISDLAVAAVDFAETGRFNKQKVAIAY